MLVPFIRARLHGLKFAAVETRFDLGFDGAIVLGPRACWAAGFEEFARIEGRNLVRCETVFLHVMFGNEGRSGIRTTSPQRSQPGDTLRVTAHAWLKSDEVTQDRATLALVGRKNASIEIRRINARRMPIDPNFVPPPSLDKNVRRFDRETECTPCALEPRP
jgi:aspartate 1-decarboxylase